jgi:hypothetical protein
MTTNAITALPAGFPLQYEFIDSEILAQRWCLPESWVRDQVRSRSSDPLPHIRFGRYVRFRWGSPELEEWALRRLVGPKNQKTQRPERIQ